MRKASAAIVSAIYLWRKFSVLACRSVSSPLLACDQNKNDATVSIFASNAGVRKDSGGHPPLFTAFSGDGQGLSEIGD
jgi:hypothetical protein